MNEHVQEMIKQEFGHKIDNYDEHMKKSGEMIKQLEQEYSQLIGRVQQI